MLQELKSVGFSLDTTLEFIWRDAIKVYTNHPQRKGGVGLLIAPKWTMYLKDKGTSPYNRVAWVTLDIKGSCFGICSIYASNDYKERTSLWNWLHSLPNIPWIMVGDFNMIESQNDKAGGLPFEWKNSERPHWDRLKKHFQLFDPMEGTKTNTPNLWHTWCNF